MEYSKKTRDKIAKILREEGEYPFKTLKNLDLKNFPKDETVFPYQCGHCGVGMGEAMPVNDCGSGCNEDEHQMNRRSEFIILEGNRKNK